MLNISVGDQIEIVAAVNRLMEGRNVRILRDYAHNTWCCLHYRPISEQQQEPKIEFLTPSEHFQWPEFRRFKTNIVEKIRNWLPHLDLDNPFGIFVIPICFKTNDASNQFLSVLMYAFGCALKFPECFCKPFGAANDMANIRKVISKALMESQMPTIEDIWGVQPDD